MSLFGKKLISFLLVLAMIFGCFVVNGATPTPTQRIPIPTGILPTPTLAPGVTPVMYVLDLKISALTPVGTTRPFRGSVLINPPGVLVTTSTSQTYRAGTMVTLKANNSTSPDGGGFWTIFSSWSGDISSSQSQVSLLMDGNKSVTANFRIFSPTVTPPRRPTPRIRVTPTPTPDRSITPTPTPTPIRGNYLVAYVISSDWGSGATVSVTITNKSSLAVNGWTLAWTFPGNQTITTLWSGTYTQSGAAVSVNNTASNSSIPVNGSVNFGFNMNYSGINSKPTTFTLNGQPCQLQ